MTEFRGPGLDLAFPALCGATKYRHPAIRPLSLVFLEYRRRMKNSKRGVAMGHSGWDAASKILLPVARKRRKLPKIACGVRHHYGQ